MTHADQTRAAVKRKIKDKKKAWHKHKMITRCCFEGESKLEMHFQYANTRWS